MDTTHAKSRPVHSLFKFGFVSSVVANALWKLLNVVKNFQEDTSVVAVDHSAVSMSNIYFKCTWNFWVGFKIWGTGTQTTPPCSGVSQ